MSKGQTSTKSREQTRGPGGQKSTTPQQKPASPTQRASTPQPDKAGVKSGAQGTPASQTAPPATAGGVAAAGKTSVSTPKQDLGQELKASTQGQAVGGRTAAIPKGQTSTKSREQTRGTGGQKTSTRQQRPASPAQRASTPQPDKAGVKSGAQGAPASQTAPPATAGGVAAAGATSTSTPKQDLGQELKASAQDQAAGGNGPVSTPATLGDSSSSSGPVSTPTTLGDSASGSGPISTPATLGNTMPASTQPESSSGPGVGVAPVGGQSPPVMSGMADGRS
ncbi:MAG: hypothetical protein GY797_04425, partial [Deltaproteobacteria bacterium]|nr:hypothetical protein [Deltaproteobacteria bacterium]